MEASVVVAIDVFHPVPSFATGLARQTEPFENFEVVVIDALDRPALAEALERAVGATGGRLRVTRHVNRTGRRAAFQNDGIARARSDLIVLLANDGVLGPDALRSHIAFHRRNPAEEAVAVGSFRSPPHQRAASRFLAWLEDSGRLFGTSFTACPVTLPDGYFACFNTSLKKAFVDKAGGFDERFPYPAVDDYELGQRLKALGMRSHYLPDAVAIHDHPITLRERCIAEYRAGLSAVHLAERPESSVEPLPDRHESKEVPPRASRPVAGGAPMLHDLAWRGLLRTSYLAGRLSSLLSVPARERAS